jgi:hypothetical protein
MDFYSEHGIQRKLSAAWTTHQNGVVERKIKTMQEMDRTMLVDSKLIDVFWVQKVCWHRGKPRVQHFNNAPTKT